MRKTGAPQEEQGAKTPAWIVSFTDMITLLLAFFVLLQAFAKEQNPDLFFEGQGAFRRAISGLGIPDVLFGKEQKIEGIKRKKRHPTEEDKNKITRSRVLDAENERIRRIFRDLKRHIETEATDVKTRQISVISTPLEFDSAGASLNASAREYLDGLAVSMKQNLDRDAIRIYVVGSAADMPAGRDQWLCSARRAKAAADFLQEVLSGRTGERSWRLISWGAGAGGRRDRLSDAAARREFIRIAIIAAEQYHGGR